MDKAGISMRNVWHFDYVVVTCYELIGLECVDRSCAGMTTFASVLRNSKLEYVFFIS